MFRLSSFTGSPIPQPHGAEEPATAGANCECLDMDGHGLFLSRPSAFSLRPAAVAEEGRALLYDPHCSSAAIYATAWRLLGQNWAGQAAGRVLNELFLGGYKLLQCGPMSH